MAQQWAFHSSGDHRGNLLSGHNVTEAKAFFNSRCWVATELWVGQRKTHGVFALCFLYAMVAQARQKVLGLILFQFMRLNCIWSVRGTHES